MPIQLYSWAPGARAHACAPWRMQPLQVLPVCDTPGVWLLQRPREKLQYGRPHGPACMRAPLVQRSYALVAAKSAGGLRHLRQLPLICKHYQWDSAAGGSLLRPASGSNKQSKRANCTAKPYSQGLPVHQVVFVEHERDWHARVLLADEVGLQALRRRGAGMPEREGLGFL